MNKPEIQKMSNAKTKMDLLTRLMSLFSDTGGTGPKTKPWQIGKPWCMPFVPTIRLLWDSARKGTYVYHRHGPL